MLECGIESPSEEFSKLSPTLVARLARYIMLNNLAEHDDYNVKEHKVWSFSRLSIPRFLHEADLGDVKNCKKLLLEVRRWLSQIGILNNYDRHRVVYIGYTQLGLTLYEVAKKDESRCLLAFRKAFEAYCQEVPPSYPYGTSVVNSLTELRFTLAPEETFNGFCQLCELAWSISKATELNPELTKHAFILELAGHFTCHFLRGDEKMPTYRFRFSEYHTNFYQRWMTTTRTVFRRDFSSSWDMPPLDRAVETVLQFLTGWPKYCRNFKETKNVVETAILKIESEKAAAQKTGS